MQYTKFGRTSRRVSRLCLGTITFGLLCDEAQSRAILDAAAEGGIDFLDLDHGAGGERPGPGVDAADAARVGNLVRRQTLSGRGDGNDHHVAMATIATYGRATPPTARSVH